MRMWRPEFLIAIIGCSLLILSISSGSSSAVEATNAVPVSPWLVAPCDFTEGAQEPDRCQGDSASLFNLAAISPVSLPLRWDDHPVTGIAGAKPFNAEEAPREPPIPRAPTNGRWLVSSVTASAETAEPTPAGMPQPHWSHLPIWGVEAEAKGFQIPLPFGIGVNYYRENQPFNIDDLKLGVRGRSLERVSNFVQLDRVDTTQWSVAARIDAWIFPFLNLYGLAGYTSGKMDGIVGIPAVPGLGIAAQTLPISISYEGPTFGGGATLAGGFKVSEWRDLTAFMVVDANYTITPLSFTDDKLFTDTDMKAFIFTPRVGLRGKVTQSIHAAIWGGAMYEDVSEELGGQSADGSFIFFVNEGPVAPWNALIGGRIEIGRHLDFVVEGGIGTRTSILAGGTFRF